ncbi:hypothetical protein OGAPHI_001858 [Ogataea philodendri]|uniref:Cyclin-D1-binding protein 1-like N-terminal domain-containing protein n=1 Tax=Ogataea philodendri TaxID=1378263 RepID=A0A9P8T750_9ASCO|nr:uncharacterized protein OGAPHI_001858 [Ogataea philodendri]KAH3668104.1 hypothetical protein OGAPHI_001858 [Ogataea philodendri]
MPSVSKSKQDLQQLLHSLDENIVTWTPLLSTHTDSNTPTLRSSQVADPLAELGKLAKLVHAHTTKVGIVFKPPISPDNYHACFVEVEALIRTLVLLVSLCSQLVAEKKKYSNLYVQAIVEATQSLLGFFSGLSKELVEMLDAEDGEGGARLVSVGKIWDVCDTFGGLVQNGASGVIRAKFKDSAALIGDGLEEYEEWLEDPSAGNGDFFDQSDEEEDLSNQDDEVDPQLVEFGKKWVPKLKLIKLLFATMDKNIGKTRYTEKESSLLDTLNSKRLEIGQLVDEFVSTIIYDLDLPAAKKNAKELIRVSTETVRLVSGLDAKKAKWFDTWKLKFQESI